MNYKRRKRFSFILVIIIGVSTTVALTLYALNKNINVYFTPSQITQSEFRQQRNLRLGGMVVKGSFHRSTNSLNVDFRITDYQRELTIRYNGVLPSLFKEGQGVVAEGKFDRQGYFVATQILAKHDEKYMPPNIPRAKEIK